VINLKESVNDFIARSVIVVIILIAIAIFATSFFHLPKLDYVVYHHVANQHFLQRLLALAMLIVVWNLHARKRTAWIISVIALTASLFLNFALHIHFVSLIIIVLEIYALIALLITQDHFKRRSDRVSLKNTGIMVCVILVAVVLNAALGYFRLRAHTDSPLSFGDSLISAFKMLIFADSSTLEMHSYELFVFFFIWLSVAVCVFMLFRTGVVQKNVTRANMERALGLVRKYGQNPFSYLALEDDKYLFFGKEVDGVIAYGYVGGTIAVLGDPICAPKDFVTFLAEFKSYCKEGSYECVFIGATDVFVDQYDLLGYSHVKCGDEARIDLREFDLAGKKIAKLRTLINRANRESIITHEYKPLEKRDAGIEKAMSSISKEWLEGKKSGELGFSIAGTGIEDPKDRRYFYATVGDEKIVGFHVFIPFMGMKGYAADITRRSADAPKGVTEKLNFDAFMTFKEEGYEWGTLGLAPLSHMLEGDEKDSASAKLLNYVYEHMNAFYGFKALFVAKEKYAPTIWVPQYFVFSTKTMTPEIAYTIVRIQNPGGIGDFFKGFLKGKAQRSLPKKTEAG